MTKCLAQLTPAELAEYLFRHRDQDIEFTFYANYDPAAHAPEWAYLVEICNFADARCLFINYVGGGNLFCYEFGDDSDASGLTGLLTTYAVHNGFETDLWAQFPPEFKNPRTGASEASTGASNVIAVVESGSVTKAYAYDERITLTIIDKDIDIEDEKERSARVERKLIDDLNAGYIFPIGIS